MRKKMSMEVTKRQVSMKGSYHPPPNHEEGFQSWFLRMRLVELSYQMFSMERRGPDPGMFFRVLALSIYKVIRRVSDSSVVHEPLYLFLFMSIYEYWRSRATV